MAEVSTTLGAGLLAVPYLAGSGTMTVTPATWPNGLPFPSSGVFSIAVKFGTGPKFPVYTVTAVATSGSNRIFTVALEAGTDQSADAGALVNEVQSTRSLNALIAQSGGGGGPTYHYQYFAGGVVANIASPSVGLINGPNESFLTAAPPAGLGGGGAGVAEFGAGGFLGMIAVFVPASWDGSDITLGIDGVFSDAGNPPAGTGIFSAYAGPLAVGANANVPTWSASGLPISQTGGGVVFPNFPLVHWDVIVPVSGVSAAQLLYIGVARSALDTFSGSIFVLGVNVGIKY